MRSSMRCANVTEIFTAVMKEILRMREGLDIGGVRKPLPNLVPEDMEQVKKCAAMIDAAVKAYC